MMTDVKDALIRNQIFHTAQFILAVKSMPAMRLTAGEIMCKDSETYQLILS